MRAFLGLSALWASAIVLAGCGDDDCGRSRCGGDTGIPDAGFDVRLDAPMDVVDMRCTSNAECADEHDCTADDCAPSGVCRHTARSEMCGEGMTCSAMSGCVAGCSNNGDCDDGLVCNGTEMCISMECYTAENSMLVQPMECDDGNECTEDRCDEDVMGCVADNMCDSGVGDGGMTRPFDATMDYTGRFVLGATMGLSTTCLNLPSGGYSVSTVTFSVAGGTLTVTGGGATMTGTLPGTGTFSVMGSYGCAQISLNGNFTDSDNFSGTFGINVGGCSCTGSTSTPVTGARL